MVFNPLGVVISEIFLRLLRSVRLVFRVFVCILAVFLVNLAICTTDFSNFSCFYRRVRSLIYLARQSVRLIFPIFICFYRSVCSLIYLARQPVRLIFPIFICFYRSVCSLIYLARQPVRLIFPIFTCFSAVFAFWSGVSYFPEFQKLLISRHVAH